MHQYLKSNENNEYMVYFDSNPPFYDREYHLTKDLEIESFISQDNVHYIYDMGDYWEHTITLMQSHPNEIGDQKVICIGGSHDTPPEDVGGVGGYLYFLEVLSDKSHPDYEHLKSWSKLTKTAKFNLHTINNKLQKNLDSTEMLSFYCDTGSCITFN